MPQTNPLTNTEILRGLRNPLPKDPFQPDTWQQTVLDHKGNITLRCGRQTGKTEIISRKVKSLAKENNAMAMNILIAAPSKTQSAHAYQMTLDLMKEEHWFYVDRATTAWEETYPDKKLSAIVKKWLERTYGIFYSEPTKSEIILKGKECGTKPLTRWEKGSSILSMPVGKTGVYIRCKTLDVLVGEEAAFIPEAVWVALLPMLAVSEKTRGFGWQILLSTPFGKGGHFFHSHFDKDFKQIHVSAEACPRISREFLKKERERLSSVEYAQEYLGNFTEAFDQFFSTELIKSCMTFMEWNYATDYKRDRSYYLGSDIARYGKDDNAFVTAEMHTGKSDTSTHDEDVAKVYAALGETYIPKTKNITRLKIIEPHTTKRKSIPDTARHHEILDQKFHYRKFFTDDAGVGGGCHDMMQELLGKSRVFGISNATKSIDETRKGRILKEDLYSNALKMMESGEVEIINNMKLLSSLKNTRFQYTKDKNIIIYGKESHLTEAFVRACWAVKEKGLRLFCA